MLSQVLKIDLAFMILGNPLTRWGSIPNDNYMGCRDGGRESVGIDELNSYGTG